VGFLSALLSVLPVSALKIIAKGIVGTAGLQASFNKLCIKKIYLYLLRHALP
jgi:hypothetical protein